MDFFLIGTPDEVRDLLQSRLDAAGYERVLLLMALPGMETDLALRSMRLFAEKVAPAMRPGAQKPWPLRRASRAGPSGSAGGRRRYAGSAATRR
jgi:hypothetical protein